MANEVLNGAEDIVLIRPATNRENFVFAARPSAEFTQKIYDASISDASEQQVSAFKYWQMDGAQIKGSSTFLGLRLDKKALRPLNIRVPDVLEARALESQGKLTNGVYRDLGMAIYSDSSPNQEIAHSLIERARKEGWDLPLVVPFRSLDYSLDKDAQYGVRLSFVENPQGVLSGKEANQVLSAFNWKGNEGALRLVRYYVGGWIADWFGLGDSDADGRVGDCMWRSHRTKS